MTHQYYPTHDFFKLLRVLKKAVTNKRLNWTTEAVEEIKDHHAEKVSPVCFYSSVTIIIVLFQTVLTQTVWENVFRKILKELSEA